MKYAKIERENVEDEVRVSKRRAFSPAVSKVIAALPLIISERENSQ